DRRPCGAPTTRRVDGPSPRRRIDFGATRVRSGTEETSMPKLHVGPRRLHPVRCQAEQEQPYRHLALQPLSPTIGPELSGVDLGADLDDETIAEVRRALLEYKVVFFRDQHISTEQHLDFARRFGELETHPFAPQKDGYPEVLLLEKNEQMGGYENVWHSD